MNQKQTNAITQCICGGTGVLIYDYDGFYVKCDRTHRGAGQPAFKTERKAVEYWNATQKNMDNLARDAIVAAHMGMTYGKYMPIKVQDAKTQETKSTGTKKENCKICAICGGEIEKGTWRIKYCSATCADIAVNRQRNEYKKKNKL